MRKNFLVSQARFPFLLFMENRGQQYAVEEDLRARALASTYASQSAFLASLSEGQHVGMVPVWLIFDDEIQEPDFVESVPWPSVDKLAFTWEDEPLRALCRDDAQRPTWWDVLDFRASAHPLLSLRRRVHTSCPSSNAQVSAIVS